MGHQYSTFCNSKRWCRSASTKDSKDVAPPATQAQPRTALPHTYIHIYAHLHACTVVLFKKQMHEFSHVFSHKTTEAHFSFSSFDLVSKTCLLLFTVLNPGIIIMPAARSTCKSMRIEVSSGGSGKRERSKDDGGGGGRVTYDLCVTPAHQLRVWTRESQDIFC